MTCFASGPIPTKQDFPYFTHMYIFVCFSDKYVQSGSFVIKTVLKSCANELELRATPQLKFFFKEPGLGSSPDPSEHVDSGAQNSNLFSYHPTPNGVEIILTFFLLLSIDERGASS
jgi:hypothetical protein